MNVPNGSPKDTGPRPARPPQRPSRHAIEKRVAQAERQRDFATSAGWADVASAYGTLAAQLRALL